jgi:hypothetical protein
MSRRCGKRDIGVGGGGVNREKKVVQRRRRRGEKTEKYATILREAHSSIRLICRSAALKLQRPPRLL